MSDDQISLLDNTIVSGGEMAREWLANRQARNAQQEAERPTQAPAQDYSKDFDALRSTLDNVNKANAQLEGRLTEMGRQQSSLTQWIQSQTAQRPAQAPPPQEPTFAPTGDPTLDAALNALSDRVAKTVESKVNAAVGTVRQQQFEDRKRDEVRRANAALEKIRAERPDFSNVVTNEQIIKFVQPFVNDPTGKYLGNVDWENEFRGFSRTAEHPLLEAQVAELKRENEALKKGHKGAQSRQREEQTRNLDRVPQPGRGGGGTTTYTDSNVSIADQVLGAYRKQHGRRAIQPWDQFGRGVIGAIRKKYDV